MNYYPPQGAQQPAPQQASQRPVPRAWPPRAQPSPMTQAATGKLVPPPPGTRGRIPYLYPPGSVQAFFGRHAFVMAFVLFVVGYLVFLASGVVVALAGVPGLEGEIVSRALTVAALVGVYALVGGTGEIRPTKVGLRTAMTAGMYPLILSLAMALLSPGTTLVIASGLFSIGGMVMAVETAVLCLLIGAFEEMLTRGLVMSGLQQRWGKSTGGLLACVYVSAALFGVLHVIPDVVAVVLGQMPCTAFVVLQMILKTVQTGAMGVLLGAIVIRTHSIWGAALIHALDDFFLMLPMVLSGGTIMLRGTGAAHGLPLLLEATAGSGYIDPDPETGIYVVILYVVWNLMYLPFFFSAVRLVKSAALPDTGCMCEEYVAHEIEEYDRHEVVFLRPLMPVMHGWQAPAPQHMATPYQMPYAPQWAAQVPQVPVAQTAWQTMPTPTWQQPPHPIAQPQAQVAPQQVRYQPQAQYARQAQYPPQAPQPPHVQEPPRQAQYPWEQRPGA